MRPLRSSSFPWGTAEDREDISCHGSGTREPYFPTDMGIGALTILWDSDLIVGSFCEVIHKRDVNRSHHVIP